MPRRIQASGLGSAASLPALTLMTPLIYQTGPKTSAKSGWSFSMRENRCISGRSLVSGLSGLDVTAQVAAWMSAVPGTWWSWDSVVRCDGGTGARFGLT